MTYHEIREGDRLIWVKNLIDCMLIFQGEIVFTGRGGGIRVLCYWWGGGGKVGQMPPFTP